MVYKYLTHLCKQRIYYRYIHGMGGSTEASMSFHYLEKL